ncbi:ATP-grasp domain-containing protein [Companilactobacillus sp. DQM5]|uniref:ATP-grasp domain-containing protein n=1 Tax=Companilactobacillus sp. DQM5 TaxID=3463359 RepID=UPI00405A2069
MREYLEPGSTIGVIGGGYETYLLLIQAHKMGFKTNLAVNQDNDEAVAGADNHIVVNRYDYENIKKIAENSDILLYQNIDIDNEDLEKIASEHPVIQGTELLTLSQDRYLERTFLDGLNINISPFFLVINDDDLKAGVKKVGYPCILKPIQKGISKQLVFNTEEDFQKLLGSIEFGTYILEAYVVPQKSFSITLAKNVNEKIHTYPLTNNKYENDVLVNSTVFIKNDPRIEEEIQRVSLKIAKSINYVGLLCVNFILGDNNTLYVKDFSFELPYSANTYELATGYSQFELQLRAVANWPIPEIFPLMNATILRIFENQRDDVLKLLKQKPQWKFLFHNARNKFNQEDEIGYILVSSTEEDFLKSNINNTKIWTID